MSIPFIECENGKYIVNEEAKKFLKTVPPDVAFIVVVGKYRTGKSFLMNRCLLQTGGDEGFGVGSTVKSCTKGIWLFPRIIEVGTGMNRRKVIVLDSEGIASLDADTSHDAKIFALALLLSSQFVYNSVGSIDEGALDTLSLVLKVSEEIRFAAHENGKQNDQDDLMPRFKWVVRDFVLQLVDDESNPISSNQYLEDALSPIASGDVQKNSVRETIRQCFPNRSCTTLVRPCTEEGALQQLNTLPFSEMRKEFVQGIEELRNDLLLKAPVKRFMGTTVSGNMLVSLAESFCNAINKGAVPEMRNSWTLMCDIRNRDLVDTFSEQFIETTEGWEKSQAPLGVMAEALKKLREEYVSDFVKSASSGVNVEELSGKLESLMARRSGEICKQLEENLSRLVVATITDVDKKVKAMVGSECPGSWGDVVQLISVAMEEFATVTKNDQPCIDALKCAMMDPLLRWGTIILGHCEAVTREASTAAGRVRELEQELAERGENCISLEGELHTLKQAHESRLSEVAAEHESHSNELLTLVQTTTAEKDAIIKEYIEKQDSLCQENVALRLRCEVLEAQEESTNARVTVEEVDDPARLVTYVEDIERLNLELKEAQVKNAQQEEEMNSKETEMNELNEANRQALDELRFVSNQRLEEYEGKYTRMKNTLEGQLKSQSDGHTAEIDKLTSTLSHHERRIVELEQDVKDTKVQLQQKSQAIEAEKQHKRDLLKQLEATREEYTKYVNSTQNRVRSIEAANQKEILSMVDKMMLNESKSKETQKAQEGAIKQLEERSRGTKRRYDEVCQEMDHLRSVRLQYEQSQLTIVKLQTEIDFIKARSLESDESAKDLKKQISSLEQDNMALGRKLLVESFKNESMARQ